MATAIALHQQPEFFYAPEFQVKVNGQDLADEVIHDILQTKYTDSIEKIDSFELSLNNWDDQRFRPKYEPPSQPPRQGLFDPGKRVELRMGYAGDLRLMMTGEVTALEASYDESGPMTLTVRGLNQLHRFRAAQHTYAWENETDSNIAEDIGRRPVSRNLPGLGVRVRTKPKDEPTEPYVLQDNQFDVVFLLARARKRGYELVLKEDDDQEQYLYFGPSEEQSESPPRYLLEWGRSLMRFQPTLSTALQIAEVTVRGWDRRRNRKIEVTEKLIDNVPRAERTRYQQLLAAFGGRSEVISDQPVHSTEQARTLAKRRLTDQYKSMVTASGSTIGLPELRAGRRVNIVGLGDRFDGQYFLIETTHRIGSTGYTTEFQARRENRAEGAAQS